MKRVLLFIATNLAVVLVLSVVASLLGVDRFITRQGMNFTALLGFAVVFGFGGAFISLFMSKQMALWTTGARVLRNPSGEMEQWLVSTVSELAQKSKIGKPDVAIYPGPELNAFATGANRNGALVAVSEGLLRGMRREEIHAVLAHEVAHVANGDMITMTLLQGVLNTFVIAVSKAVAWAVAQTGQGEEEEGGGGGMSYMAYMVTSIVLQIVLGMAASVIVMAFSRYREFRADAGAAALVGPTPMIAALKRLSGDAQDSTLPEAVSAFGIREGKSLMALFSSHPPIVDRVKALEDIAVRQKI